MPVFGDLRTDGEGIFSLGKLVAPMNQATTHACFGQSGGDLVADAGIVGKDKPGWFAGSLCWHQAFVGCRLFPRLARQHSNLAFAFPAGEAGQRGRFVEASFA